MARRSETPAEDAGLFHGRRSAAESHGGKLDERERPGHDQDRRGRPGHDGTQHRPDSGAEERHGEAREHPGLDDVLRRVLGA